MITNFDRIKDEIQNIRFGLINGEVKPCNEISNIYDGMNCRRCDFYRDPDTKNFVRCENLRFEWLKQEE